MPRTVRISASYLVAALAAASGCTAAARIPYDYGAVPTRPGPVHPLRVAVLPLVDARPAAERESSDRFVYRGLDYRGTLLTDLPPPPMFEVTEVVGRHLARTRVFAQVVLVRDAGQGWAENADLLLTGRVYRLRGYAEAEAPVEKSGRSPEERKVLAEVALMDLKLENRQGLAVMHSDTGWAISTVRRLGADGAELDPWRILGDAMQVALTKWSDDLAQADLSGNFVVRDRVELTAETATVASGRLFGRLPEQPPEGWQFVMTSTAATPRGWRGPRDCRAVHLALRQTTRFHRVLGPYQPRVNLWACPERLLFELDSRADFPARVLGRARGHWYFVHALGQSNWPRADRQIAEHLGLTSPKKYLFRVGGP